ncbi:MAG: Sugar phosphate isomerase/epimerase [Candidatus Methanocomedens sp.]|nr:MAG: Sugar phosphate isomerase/epimerase [ANME-2 cluster archaeon]
MEISCSSLFLWDYGIDEIATILGRAGIENIEFWAETPEFWQYRHEAKVVEHLEDVISTFFGHVTVHAPIMDLNPSSYNEHVRKATIKETFWAIDLSSKLDARVLTIHPGNRTVHRQPTPEDWEKFFDYLTVCTGYAREMGVVLALENLSPRLQNMCYKPSLMRDVLAKYPDLMMTFDIAHALQTGQDNALDFINELGGRIVNVHVGGVQNGTPHYPGHMSRNREIIEILGRLQRSGYDNDLTIEIDDKLISRDMSRSDKISALIKEKVYLIQALNIITI